MMSSSDSDEPSALLQKCTCTNLKATDIPGAVLPRTPEKCKVNELRIWLKSRCQRVKSKETKSELVLRVKKCLEQVENLQVVDPHPGQPYLAKRKANCNACSPKDKTTQQQSVQSEKSPTWTQKTSDLPQSFSYLDILNYSKKSGKNTKYIEKPIDKGYAFYFDGYVFNQEVGKRSDCISVRARCYRSMKKSETPHSLTVFLSVTGAVTGGNCSCVAGAGGHCNHIYALLYSIDHVIKLKLDTFVREKTCTDLPAQWVKSRTEGVRSEPVMTASVVKPKYGSQSKGIKSSLYEARGMDAKKNLEVTNDTISKLGKINPLFGVCMTVGNQAQSTSTRLGFTVPHGSPLSYQLSQTEGNFSVSANVSAIKGTKCDNVSKVPNFPWNDSDIDEIPQKVLIEAGLHITSEQATDIFNKTTDQSSCELWHEVRKCRLTASKFGAIVRRKKDKGKFIKTQLLVKKNLSNMPSIKYGQENEEKALKQYIQYMNNTGRRVKAFKAGCVINSNFPWLAASPDGILFDEDAGFGLIEVKCTYSKRNITPVEACMDPSFFCKYEDGHFKLKKDHEYYAQVQGQLGVCGALFCDFIAYTNKGLGIQRIAFDHQYWREMTPKLRDFFLTDFMPEIKEK